MSFSALINITIFSGIAIVVLKYLFKDNKVILRLDIRFVLLCLLLILFRSLIPVESPITNNIAISRVYPDIYMFLKEPRGSVFGRDISIMTVLKLIWLTGSAVILAGVLFSYRKLQRSISSLTKIEDERMIRIVDAINAQRKHPVYFRLVTMDWVDTPFVFGILKPYIIVPEMELSEKELELILRHEVLHYYRGDLLIRFLCEVLKAIYWWNPFTYILSDLIGQMQEINVDFKVMKSLPDAEKLDYSECLVKVARMREKRRIETRWSVAFQKENSSLVRKRISLMLDNLEISKSKTVASVLLSVAILMLVVVCPNVFIFEPYGISEEDAQGSVGLSDGEIFYLRNEDGMFELYVGGQYIKTVVEVSDTNIPIFDNMEETKKNE